MKILLVHNHYKYRGGECRVLSEEENLLMSRGNSVVRYTRDNREIDKYGLLKKLALGLNGVWSRSAYAEIRNICRVEKPDVAHFHNINPMISPSAYHACKDEGVPVVQTLHNFRMICPGAFLMRRGKVCVECMADGLARSIWRRCYRKSAVQTAAVASMIYYHRRIETWLEKVDKYIALTQFSKNIYISGGIPEEKIAVKPNFMADPGMAKGDQGYAVYLGRLSAEKGIKVLLEAWKSASGRALWIAGDGPETGYARREAEKYSNMIYLGGVDRSRAMEIMKGARYLVVPSIWYENLPMTIIEAYACGKPVIASRIGSLPEIVHDGETGLLFEAGNYDDLRAKIEMMDTEVGMTARMGDQARKVYENEYSPEHNYEILMKIYNSAAASGKSARWAK